MLLSKEEQLSKLTESLRNNQSVVIKTDTVYGILSLHESSIAQIKQRDIEVKKTVRFIWDVSQISKDIPKDLLELAKHFWPGKLTIIFKGIGYRIPNHEVILGSLRELNVPIYSSSANITNCTTVGSISEAKEVFKDLKDIVYIDDQESNSCDDKASTVYDYDNNRVLREGAIKSEVIFEFIKGIKEEKRRSGSW